MRIMSDVRPGTIALKLRMESAFPHGSPGNRKLMESAARAARSASRAASGSATSMTFAIATRRLAARPRASKRGYAFEAIAKSLELAVPHVALVFFT